MTALKKKKHTLLFDQTYEFDLLGICSHHSDYRLVWAINNALNLRLQKCEADHPLINKKGETVSTHVTYMFEDTEDRLEYILIKNKGEGKNYLVPEKQSIDYFLILNNNVAIDPAVLAQKLKKVGSILGVFSFDVAELSSVENLIFY